MRDWTPLLASRSIYYQSGSALHCKIQHCLVETQERVKASPGAPLSLELLLVELSMLLLLVLPGTALLTVSAIGLRALGELPLSARAEGKPQPQLSATSEGRSATSEGRPVKAAAVPAVSSPATPAAANRDLNSDLAAACLDPLCSVLNTDERPICGCML